MFTENLSEFFDVDEMAEIGLIKSFKIAGIFDNQYIDIHGVEGFRPIFVCSEKLLPPYKHGDEMIINNNDFHIVGAQPDGTGLISLILEKQ